MEKQEEKASVEQAKVVEHVDKVIADQFILDL